MSTETQTLQKASEESLHTGSHHPGEPTPNGASTWLERTFQLSENNTNIRTEILAGVTTFFATAFTILSIPNMIAGSSPDTFGPLDPRLAAAIFIGATLAAAFGTFLKAFYAKLPFVQAPGMGIGSYFAVTVMPAMALIAADGADLTRAQAYQMGLVLVLVAGILFWLTSIGGLRQKIVDGIPTNIKIALGSGIGLFITLLGLRQAGITRPSPGTFVTLVNFSNWTPDDAGVIWARGAVLALGGLLVIAVLSALKVRGAILIGIIGTAVAAYITGHVTVPADMSFSMAQDWGYFFNYSFFTLDFGGLFSGGVTGAVISTLIGMVLVFTLVNMLDALGTIDGISRANDMVDENGETKRLQHGLTADAIGTVASGFLGTSSITTVVSSSTGIREGGRTGLTSLTTGLLFVVALVLAPFVPLIPTVAVAPALIFVGCLMMSNIKHVDFDDITEAVPAFLTIAIMPLTFSIANGIAFGLISYMVLKVATGKWRQVSPVSLIIAALFVAQFVLG
ncbi:MAG: NCS2 family permease [Cellulomonadaceae bacterium]|nr:NCS2 family permease [Cellulomonadaceae bacterium]